MQKVTFSVLQIENILVFPVVDLVVRQHLPQEELKEKGYVAPLKTTHH